MKKILVLPIISIFVFAACNTPAQEDPAIELPDETQEEVGFNGEWSRVATYTDGANMNTGPAWMNFLPDGTFISTTDLCTATGDYEILPEEEEQELGDMVLDAGTMAMTYVKSDCPGYTLSAITFSYKTSIGEDGGETLTMDAEYQGHIVTEVYVR
jgi:hypothetical protein